MRQLFYEVNGKKYDTLLEAKLNGYKESEGKIVFKDIDVSNIYINNLTTFNTSSKDNIKIIFTGEKENGTD